MNILKTLSALGAVSLMTAACGPQGQVPAELGGESSSTESALHTKAMQVSDESGENVIYLEVRSNDEELLSLTLPRYSPSSHFTRNHPRKTLRKPQFPKTPLKMNQKRTTLHS